MRRDLTITVFACAIISASAFSAAAQTPPVEPTPPAEQTPPKVYTPRTVHTPRPPTPAPHGRTTASQDRRKQQVQTRNAQVIVESEVVAPQIVTILHRLTGLKIMRLLRRSTEEPGSIAGLDDAFKMSTQVHTNVIAGLTLDDGKTIAAWLPEAEAEMAPSAIQYAPRAPDPPGAPAAHPRVTPPTVAPMPVPVPGLLPGFLEPDLKIVTRDGKRLLGHYLGLDGLTGLSVITLRGANLPQMVEAREPVRVGQRLRIIGPQPAPRAEGGQRSAIYVRVGQTDAVVTGIGKSPSGGIARIKIKAAKLSAANIGAIAVNEAGETLGILDSVEGHEANIVPIAAVRSAVKRVMDRKASVPRPWLGVRGEPINAMTLEKILNVGWKLDRAKELCENQNGILLTSVAPGSPAALNQLKPGDVILSVNDAQIKSGDQFSWILQEAGPGSPVQFTVARREKAAAEALEIQLSESPDPLWGRRVSAAFAHKHVEPGSLMSQGIETIAIKPKVGNRLGATGGLLVVYVHPSTAAHKAGMRPGDVIESIDGQNVSSGRYKKPLLKNPGTSSAFNIVRNKQKLQLTITTVK
jgi:S1-C subfamily serine protease